MICIYFLKFEVHFFYNEPENQINIAKSYVRRLGWNYIRSIEYIKIDNVNPTVNYSLVIAHRYCSIFLF